MNNVVTISVSSLDDTKARLASVFRGEVQGNRITFLSVEQMWKMLSPKRTDILRVMAGQGAMSIREAARRLGRDVKAVHSDITALIKAGLIDRQDGGVVFPYDGVRVDFTLGMAA